MTHLSEEKRGRVYQDMFQSQLLLSSQCRDEHFHWSEGLVQWVESFPSELQSLHLIKQITNFIW